ncbi:hypothetical protein ACFLW6_01740 [Chloroflexota bacterium]
MKSDKILKILGRNIRHESLEKLGVPTWTLAYEAIKSGNIERGLELVELARFELKQRHDSLARMLGYMMDFIAQNYGEEQIGAMWQSIGRQHVLNTPAYQPHPPEIRVLLVAETQCGHGCFDSNINVILSDAGPREEVCGSVATRGTLCKVYK